MSEIIRVLNSENTILIMGILASIGTIIHGYKSGIINLVIFYQSPDWTFSREDSPAMFWASIGFYVLVTIFTTWCIFRGR